MSKSRVQQPLLPLEPRNDRQRAYLAQLKRHDLVFGVGPAGTGKTFIAAHRGASMLDDGQIDRYVIIRSTVAVEDEDLGAIPGDYDEKIAPWARPVLAELSKIAGADRVRRWKGEGQIEAIPIALIRGLTLERTFIHVVEAQNLTAKQAMAVVTRDGDGSRMVIEGDPDQADIPNGYLPRLLEIAEGARIPHASTRFTEEDVVRSAKTRAWVQAFAAAA